jgi:hypothetical protein
MELITKISDYIKTIYSSSTNTEFKKPDGYKNVNSTAYKK